jgi:hypothetical protein
LPAVNLDHAVSKVFHLGRLGLAVAIAAGSGGSELVYLTDENANGEPAVLPDPWVWGLKEANGQVF